MDWDVRTDNGQLMNVARYLISIGMIEAAWNVAQLHSDQTQKKEAASGARLHKGHPVCGLAILGQALQSNALRRHNAQLSSAGDIYWEHKDAHLRSGGLAPTLMESFESDVEHYRWRESVRARNAGIPTTEPRYLEPFLLMRWFGEAYWDLFLNAGHVVGRQGTPFPDVLFQMIEQPATGQKGKLFEAASALLFSATPGFEVRSARKTSGRDQQIDFVVRYERDPLSVLPLAPGPGLIECKSSDGKISVNDLRDFGGKCQFLHVTFGVLVAKANITGSGANIFADPQYSELVRRRFLADGLTILVLDLSMLRCRAREMRCLQEPLAQDHDLLVFGPIDGAPPD
ncbi:MAG: restriction endonuclease [Gemmataceae bacterium]